MKKVWILTGLLLFVKVQAGAQFLKKLQEKAANAAEKVIDKKIDEKTDKLLGNGTQGSDGTNVQGTTVNGAGSAQGATTVNRTGRMANTQGGGLITSPPDVRANLSTAESSFKEGNYGPSRYAIQQAILGVEMEIGAKLLKSLPEKVSGLAGQKDQDEVSSSGWGWAGLVINRTYSSDTQQFIFSIANNSLLSSVNQFLMGSGLAMGQSTGGQQNWKQIMVKGNKAIIEYDAGSGYKLSIPLGQSSLLSFEGINFAGEQDMIAAVNEFNIDEIRKTLGEK